MLYLYEIHVRPEIQRQGLGTHLMDMVKSAAREAATAGILLTRWLKAKNEKFYEFNHFKATGLEPEGALYQILLYSV